MRLSRFAASAAFCLSLTSLCLSAQAQQQAAAPAAPAQATAPVSAPAAPVPAAPATAPVAATPVSNVSAAVKIAVLDDKKILSESKAAGSIDTQLKAKHDSVEKELSGLERKLAGEKAKLDIDKDKVKPDVFSKEVAAYQNDYLSARKFADSRQRDLKGAAEVALAQLRSAITKIVAGIADKNGYTLVLTRENVVLAVASMDITDDVLAQLDRSLTNIPVTFQSGGTAKKAVAPK